MSGLVSFAGKPITAVGLCGVLAVLMMLALVGMLDAGVSAQGLSSPENISNSEGESKRPAVAVGGDGSVHVVWEDQSEGNWEIFYASKSPDGPWSPPTNVSRNPGGSFRPGVAAAADGSVHVVWHDDTPGDYEILYSVKPPGGAWSPALNLSNSSKWSFWPSLVVGTEGFVHVAWHDLTPGNWEAFSVSRSPDGAWSPVTNLSNSAGTSFIPTLLIAGDGLVHAVWQDDTSHAFEILTASRPPDGQWSAPVNVSGTPSHSAPFAATQSTDGSLSIVWGEATAGGPRLLSVTKPPGGPWSSPEDLGGSVTPPGRFVVGKGADGSLYLVWDDSGLGNGGVDFATRAPGGGWSSPLKLSQSTDDSPGGIAVGGDGSVHVVWRGGEPGRGEIFHRQQFPESGSQGSIPPEGMVVRLGPGCSPVTTGYADLTPAETLAGAVSPAEALVAVWSRKGEGWLGYSPSYPSVSDSFRQDYGDPLFICTRGKAEFLVAP